MPTLTPRDYQENARDQIISSLDDGIKKIIVYLPTGMGKTLISIITLQYLIENEYIAPEDKVLFLVADRKLKHQLHEMASGAGLGNYGNLFVLPEGQDYPARLCRQHAAMSRFIFATPVLFINAIVARSRATQKLDRSIVNDIKVVVIDEVLDVMAQSYGKKRSQEETVGYLMKMFNVTDYDAFLAEMATRYEITPSQVHATLLKEFAPRYFRLNKKFEPVLSLLGIMNPKSSTLMIGLTASISQKAKRDFLVENLGGSEVVAEIFPEGEDYENYRPSIRLRKIRVIDEGISVIDNYIQELKNSSLANIKKAYQYATNSNYLPSDRIMLFVTDLLAKKELKDRIKARLKSKGHSNQESGELMKRFLTTASAYLLLTVGRQKLLEDTVVSFYRFVNGTKNSFLTSSDAFKKIQELISVRMEQMKEEGEVLSEKDKKLLYWVNRFSKENKKVLIMARFVNMVQHIYTFLNKEEHGGFKTLMVHGSMDGTQQHRNITEFKTNPEVVALVASERLIEKGTDLPETDVAIYYGSTISLERYEQSLGRIRSTVVNTKTAYTIAYNLTVEAEKSAKRDAAFLELLERGTKKGLLVEMKED